MRTFNFLESVPVARQSFVALSLRKSGYAAWIENDRGAGILVTNATVGEIALAAGTAGDLYLGTTSLKPGTYSKTFKFEREATEYWMNSSVRATQAGLRAVKNAIEYNKDRTYTVTTTYAK